MAGVGTVIITVLLAPRRLWEAVTCVAFRTDAGARGHVVPERVCGLAVGETGFESRCPFYQGPPDPSEPQFPH